MQKTMCYFLQSNTCIIFRLSTRLSGVLPELICSAISDLPLLDSVEEHIAMYKESGCDSCQLLLTCIGICPLPSHLLFFSPSSLWSMFNRTQERSGDQTQTPCLLQTMNHAFHTRSAVVCLVTEGTNK